MSKRDKIIWAAGFIDGEGSLSLSRSKSQSSPAVKIEACQINPKPLEDLQKLFGGKVYYWKANNGRKICEWTIQGYNAFLTAQKIYPYLVVKKQEADLLIDYMKLPWRSLRKVCGGTWIKRTDEEKLADKIYAEAMQQLKPSRKTKEEMSWECEKLFQAYGYSLPVAYAL